MGINAPASAFRMSHATIPGTDAGTAAAAAKIAMNHKDSEIDLLKAELKELKIKYVQRLNDLSSPVEELKKKNEEKKANRSSKVVPTEPV